MVYTRRSLLCLSLVALLAFSQVACTQSEITLTLGLIVSSAQTFLDIADPPVAALAAPYFTQVNAFVSFSTAELASTDSGATKASRIAQEALKLSVPNLPAGTPQSIANALSAVVTNIINFIAAIHSLSAELTATPAGALAFAASGPKAVKLNHKDKTALKKIEEANAKLKARLKSIPK